MAEARVIRLLDAKLMEEGLIEEAYVEDYKKVHRFLNSRIKKSGTNNLPAETFEEVELLLREWLLTLYKQGASQEKLTSYLRCGLAHMTFDYIDSTYLQISPEDLVVRAMISYKQRHYHRSYYKPPAVKGNPSLKKGTAKKRIVPIKREKNGTKKRVAKKAAKKSGSAKKTVGKKTAKKKSLKKSLSRAQTKATKKKKTALKKKGTGAAKKTNKKSVTSKKKSPQKGSRIGSLFQRLRKS